jgi:integrase
MKATLPTGIRRRHARSCKSKDGGTCNCDPSYEAWAWSAREQKKIRETFTDLSEAKNWRADSIGNIRRGKLKAPTQRTLDEEATSWLERAAAGTALTKGSRRYKPSMIRAVATDFRLYISPDLGNVKLSALRRADVQRRIDDLTAKGLSGSRVRGIVTSLKVVLRRPLQDDELAVDPTERLRLPAPAGSRDRVASPTEVAELIGALELRDRPLWACAAYAGLRRGELRALRWRHVDLTANVISVEAGWDDREGEIDPKSSKGRRRVPMAGMLRLFLLEHGMRNGRDEDAFVFGSDGRPFVPASVRKRALTTWKKANAEREAEAERLRQEAKLLEPIGLHELRHCYVSIMVDAGFTLERIGDYVGHSSAYMTDRYRHLLEGHEAEATERLDSYLTRMTGAPTGAQSAENLAFAGKTS